MPDLRRRSIPSISAALLAVMALMILAGKVAADDSLDVQIGFDGVYKVGHWTPIRVVFGNADGVDGSASQVSVDVPDGDGIMCKFPLERAADGSYAGYVRVGQQRSALRIAIDNELHEWPLPAKNRVSGTQHLVLVVGADIGISDALRLRNFPVETSVRSVNHSRLPESWYAYDGVDLVILTTGNQIEHDYASLEEWVRMGGKLIVSIGENGSSLLAEGQPLAKLVPGSFRSVSRQRDTSELETFTGSNERLDLSWRTLPRAEQGVPMTLLDDPKGLIVVAEGTGKSAAPWVIRSAFGFGSVTFVGCDLDSGPVSDWTSRPRFLAELLDASLMHRSLGEERSEKGQLSHLGFSDLSGQLRAAMEQYGGVRLIPFSLIAALAIGYVILVGPIDFFALKKLAPRMEWTWLTFPLIVLGMTALAVGLARSWKSDTPSSNVVDLLDMDSASGQTRCTSWAHAYYPAGGHYAFSVSPNAPLPAADGSVVAWQGLPGSAFGGMQNRTTSTQMAQMVEPYTCTLEKVGDLPIPKWSSRSMAATWWQQNAPGKSDLKVSREELLSGSFENPLPFAIRDAVICYGRSYYNVGTIGPNATFVLGEMAQPRDFRYRLTRRRIVDDRELVDPWDKENLNVPRIMEMIMFHDKAGGRGYTDLFSRYHHELDLSDHLMTGSAVLYGRASKAATSWHVGEDSGSADQKKTTTDVTTKNWTFCRLLFPVEMNTRSRFRPEENDKP